MELIDYDLLDVHQPTPSILPMFFNLKIDKLIGLFYGAKDDVGILLHFGSLVCVNALKIHGLVTELHTLN